jgi:hypothetical protein
MKPPGHFMKGLVKWPLMNLLRSRAPAFVFMNF